MFSISRKYLYSLGRHYLPRLLISLSLSTILLSVTQSSIKPSIPSRPISPPPNSLKISIHSYNVGGALPREADQADLNEWIQANQESDVMVFGLQEMDLSSGAYLYWSPVREETWSQKVEIGLGRRRGEYEKVSRRDFIVS